MELQEKENITNDDVNNLMPQKELNKEFWENGKLKKNIRNRLREIAIFFKNELELTLKDIEDITITGSIANYNWSKYSDIDLHLIVDFDKIKEVSNKNVLKDYFKAKRNLWNNLHEIKIKGHEVEVYIQNKNETHHSTGVYSIVEDAWRKKPSLQNNNIQIDKEFLKKKTKNIINLVDFIEEKSEDEPLHAMKMSDKLQDKLSVMRSAGLNTPQGEFSVENLIYKLLRRVGCLEKLREIENKAFDKVLSIKK